MTYQKAHSTIFKHARPSIVTDDASTTDTLSDEVVAEYALKSISSLTIKMSNKFENRFVSKYTSRIFPWALNYACGGADYPNLFSDWEEFPGRQHRATMEKTFERSSLGSIGFCVNVVYKAGNANCWRLDGSSGCKESSLAIRCSALSLRRLQANGSSWRNLEPKFD